MSRFNTGNPLGSGSPLDLDDNAKNMDLAVNSQDPAWTDRFGVSRATLAGQEDRFDAFIESSGYQFVGDYAAGIELTEYNQLIRDSGGEFWRVSGQIDLPYTTSGNGVPESDALVSVGDAVLRQDLAGDPANGLGASMVSTGASTVSEELGTLKDEIGYRVYGVSSSVELQSLELGVGSYARTGVDGFLWEIVAGGTGQPDGKRLVDIANGNQAQRLIMDSEAVSRDGQQFDISSGSAISSAVTAESAAISKTANLKAITVLGDSISHGAFAKNLYLNGWVNIFKRMINVENDSTHYGFAPLLTIDSGGPNESLDIHQIGFVNTGGGWSALEAATGGDIPQGVGWESTGTGNILSSTIPTFQNRGFVWYQKKPSGGTFDIKINGSIVASVDTAGALDRVAIRTFSIVDNAKGKCKIEVVTTSSDSVVINGFSYLQSGNEPMVNNWSTSGRRLVHVSELSIRDVMRLSSTVLMALGYNDSGDNETTPSYYANFVQRIDWLIAYANIYGTKVIVPDFVWIQGPESKTRKQLQRLARETGGLYIPIPDYIRTASGPATNDHLVNTLKLWTDGAHPNIAGHKFLAETIAKALGLSVSTKKQAIDFHDWWYPLEIANSGSDNRYKSSDYVSAAKRNGDLINVRINITGINVAGRNVQSSWPARLGLVAKNSISYIYLQDRATAQNLQSLSVSSAGEIIAMSTGTPTDTSRDVLFSLER